MTFLELVRQLRGDCGIQGDGPDAVDNQTSMLAKLVRWTREAFVDIQTLPHRFDWMRAEVELPVSVGVFEYPIATAPWNRPDIRTFDARAALVNLSDGTAWSPLVSAPLQDFSERFPTITAQGTPHVFTKTLANHVRFNALPTASGTFRATVTLAPQLLVAADEVPRLPVEFHGLIVHRAVMKYATHDGDASLFNASQADYRELLRKLIVATVPAIEYRPVPLVR